MNEVSNALRIAIGEALSKECEQCAKLREQIRELRAQVSARDRLIQSRGYDSTALTPLRKIPAEIQQEGNCFYCDAPLHIDTVTEDHFIPRSKGGKGRHCIKVLACVTCNVRKADRMPTEEEWKKLISRLRGKRRDRAINARLALALDSPI